MTQSGGSLRLCPDLFISLSFLLRILSSFDLTRMFSIFFPLYSPLPFLQLLLQYETTLVLRSMSPSKAARFNSCSLYSILLMTSFFDFRHPLLNFLSFTLCHNDLNWWKPSNMSISFHFLYRFFYASFLHLFLFACPPFSFLCTLLSHFFSCCCNTKQFLSCVPWALPKRLILTVTV